MATNDILTAIADLPRDVQVIIHRLHKLNVIEDTQRAAHAKVVQVLERMASCARWQRPFADWVLCELECDGVGFDEIYEDTCFNVDDDLKPYDECDYPAVVYDVDVFDRVACWQHMLKAKLMHKIENTVKLIE